MIGGVRPRASVENAHRSIVIIKRRRRVQRHARTAPWIPLVAPSVFESHDTRSPPAAGPSIVRARLRLGRTLRGKCEIRCRRETARGLLTHTHRRAGASDSYSLRSGECSLQNGRPLTGHSLRLETGHAIKRSLFEKAERVPFLWTVKSTESSTRCFAPSCPPDRPNADIGERRRRIISNTRQCSQT